MNRTVYLVQRQAMGKYGLCCDSSSGLDTGSRMPLRLFTDREKAVEFVRMLEADARQSINPFQYLPCEDDESPESEEFQARLRRLGLKPPSGRSNYRDWRSWWDAIQHEITDAQRAAVWAEFRARPLYEIVELPLED